MSPSVLDLLQHYGIPFVALVVCAGELGVPTGVPSEVLLLLAGSYAVHSLPGLIVAVLAVALADIVGTTTLHRAARGRGAHLLTRFIHHGAEPGGFLDRLRRRLGGHDAAWVFVGRLLPIVRMPVTVSAGLLQIRDRDFLLGAVPASALWAGTPLAIGYFFRGDVDRIEARYSQVTHLFLFALPIIAVLGAVAWWAHRGGAPAADLRRGRGALGALAAALALAYLAWTVWAYQRVFDRGVAALPFSAVALHLIVVAALALALLWLAGADLAATRHQAAGSGARLTRTELATTVAWVVLVAAVGAAIATMARQYPAP